MIFKKLDVSDSKGLEELGVSENRVVVRFKDNPELRYLYALSAERIEELKNAEKKGSYFFRNIRHDSSVKWKQI